MQMPSVLLLAASPLEKEEDEEEEDYTEDEMRATALYSHPF